MRVVQDVAETTFGAILTHSVLYVTIHSYFILLYQISSTFLSFFIILHFGTFEKKLVLTDGRTEPK